MRCIPLIIPWEIVSIYMPSDPHITIIITKSIRSNPVVEDANMRVVHCDTLMYRRELI